MPVAKSSPKVVALVDIACHWLCVQHLPLGKGLWSCVARSFLCLLLLSSPRLAMSSQKPCKYKTVLKSLMRMHPELGVLADDAVTTDEWVEDFSSTLVGLLFLLGPEIGTDRCRILCLRLVPM